MVPATLDDVSCCDHRRQTGGRVHMHPGRCSLLHCTMSLVIIDVPVFLWRPPLNVGSLASVHIGTKSVPYPVYPLTTPISFLTLQGSPRASASLLIPSTKWKNVSSGSRSNRSAAHSIQRKALGIGGGTNVLGCGRRLWADRACIVSAFVGNVVDVRERVYFQCFVEELDAH